MSTFELNFGLASVILGLALTHLANSLRKLVLKGRDVAWAPEPLLQAFAILMIIVAVWMSQFSRSSAPLSEGVALLNVLRMLTLYFAAGFCLPDPEAVDGKVDLAAYYDRTRRFSYGALIGGLLIFWVYNTVVAPGGWRADLIGKLVPIAVWVALIFSRWRWLNLLLLAVPIVGQGNEILQASLAR
jgi:hypothetical protein